MRAGFPLVIGVFALSAPPVSGERMLIDCTDAEARHYYVLRPVAENVASALVEPRRDRRPRRQTLVFVGCGNGGVVRATNNVLGTGQDWPDIHSVAEAVLAKDPGVTFSGLADALGSAGFPSSVGRMDADVQGCVCEAAR